MRQRGRSTSSKLHELSEEVPDLIRLLESEKGTCKRSAVIDRLKSHHNASKDQAEQALEWSIRQGRVVELYTAGGGEPVLHDILRLKICRPLRLNAAYDLSHVLRTALLERGSRSSQDARSASELQDHIMKTYNLQENSVEYLSSCLDKALKQLIKKEQVEEKVPLNDNETRYFLTSLSSTPNGPQAANPSLATTSGENHKKDENAAHPPSSKSNSKEKRHSDQSHHHDCSKSELKSLQDSLSQFFTPTNSRRSRVAQSSFSAERFNAENEQKLRNPLEVVVPNSNDGLKRSGGSTAAHHTPNNDLNVSPSGSTPSPNRQTDKLVDSLSPYFSATADRRRKQHEKGQYLQLCNGGVPPKKKARTSESSSSEMNGHLSAFVRHSKHNFFDEEQSDSEVEPLVELKVNDVAITNAKKTAEMPATTSNTTTFSLLPANSTSEIEVPRYSPSANKKRPNLRSSNAKKSPAPPFNRTGSSSTLSGLKSRATREKTLMARVSNNLLKRARQHCNARSAPGSSNQTAKLRRRAGSIISTTPKKSRAAAQPASSTIVKHSSMDNSKILQSPIRRTSFSPVKGFKLLNEMVGDEKPVKIRKQDESLYHKTRVIVQKRLDENSRLMYEKGEEGVFPSKIRIGKFEINTWYSSPYPQEYACLPKLYVCERCLIYLSNDSSHNSKCKAKYPPGTEIYRWENVSVFEVDGNSARVYCRNLCLLAKLFMDHKTLYFDVEPFLFYVLTVNDEHGSHFVGYFSKEKYSHQQFNLACIVTLPCYQKKGYGRFLIDFSYLLSRKEKLLGTPERPLSEMGKVAYESYWRTAIFEFLHNRRQEGKVETLAAMEIAQSTGIAVHDVLNTMKEVGFLSPAELDSHRLASSLCWTIDWDQVEAHWTAAKRSDRRIWLNESRLKWTPRTYTPQTDFLLRSPLRSPGLSSMGSPRKSGTFGIPGVIFRQPNIVPIRPPVASTSTTSKIKTPTVRSPQKSQRKNGQAAVLPKNETRSAHSSGAKDDCDHTRTTTMDGSMNPPQNPLLFQGGADKRKAFAAALARSTTQKKSHLYTSESSDSDFEQEDEEAVRHVGQSSASTAASSRPKKRRPQSARKTAGKRNRSGRREASSSDESDSDRSRPPAHSRLSTTQNNGAVGWKKLPAEVERAELRARNESPTFPNDQQTADSTALSRSSSGSKSRRGAKRAAAKKPGGKSPQKREEGGKGAKKKLQRKQTVPKRPSSGKKGERTSPRRTLNRRSTARSLSPTPVRDHDNSHRSAGFRAESDEDDEPYRSSASPPPINDRRGRHSLLHRSSMMSTTEMMNMGGEPDTINMGGDPLDTTMDASFTPSQAEPKAPQPHQLLDEEEETEAGVLDRRTNFIPPTNFGASNQSTAHPFPAPLQPPAQMAANHHRWSLQEMPRECLSQQYEVPYDPQTTSFQQSHRHYLGDSAPSLSLNRPPPMNRPRLTNQSFSPDSPAEQNAEMPVLKPGDSSGDADGGMSALGDEDDVADDEAPPQLSPCYEQQANSPDGGGCEPPKLEDSTRRPEPPPVVPPPPLSTVPKPRSFDSIAADTNQMPPLYHGGPGSLEEQKNDSFSSVGSLNQNPTHQSPLMVQNAPTFKQVPHPPAVAPIFSPQTTVNTPNSLQPQSHASNSTTASENLNVSDILSPNNVQKPPDPMPNYANPQAPIVQPPPPQVPVYSPPKATSRKDKAIAKMNAAVRRRNTTDGSPMKLQNQMQRPSMDTNVPPAHAAQLGGLNGMMPPFHLPPNGWMQPPISNGAQFAPPMGAQHFDWNQQAMAQQSAYHQAAALYANGTGFGPYQQYAANGMAATAHMMNAPPGRMDQFTAFIQQQQHPPMAQPPNPMMPFGASFNPALANAAAMNANAANSIYYNY